MSSDIVIRVKNLSKCYHIYDKPRDRLLQSLFRGKKQFYRAFWALKDISFEVEKGETVGIVGRNGSGKSTLLQMIAGTLTPTGGDLMVNGRVAALLELGAGFNPEFTGRENIFMNAAILGFTREEIEQRYQAIAAFADIGDFIEQPVKVYSSGMVMRLAFAVQAHVEPEILIVDEALAVGDVNFQHKCMRCMKQLLECGTTVLFVSHALSDVKRLCQRALWLESGCARFFGEAGLAVEQYLAFMRMRERGGEAEIPQGTEQEEKTVTAAHESAVPIDLATLLIPIRGEIDLREDRLFLQGRWNWTLMPHTPLLIRRCDDINALAGFQFYGNRLELLFLRGPLSDAVRVTIDDCERLVELFHPTETSLEKVSFELPVSSHTVLLTRADKPQFSKTNIWWMGGRTIHSVPLTFRSDPLWRQKLGETLIYGNGKARLTAVELLDYVSEEPVTEVSFGQRVRLRLHAERLQVAGPRLEFSFIVRDRNRIDLFGTTTIDEGIRLDANARRYVVEFVFTVKLGPGSYSILTAFVECSEDLTQMVPMEQIDLAWIFTTQFNPNRPVWYAFHEPVIVQTLVE